MLGRLLVILLLTVAVEFGASILLYERATQYSVQEDEARRLAEHLVIARKLLAERPAGERAEMARELTTDRYQVRWSPQRSDVTERGPELDSMRRQVLSWEPDLARSALRMRLSGLQHGSAVGGDLRLGDGSWVLFHTRGLAPGWGLTLGRVAVAMLPALLLIVLGGALIRLTLRPLRELIRATGRVGRGDHAPVREEGSAEIRALIHAFNEMQERIHDLIENRTQALAAVGHDLRTPIARLRLRLGDRDEIAEDLDEMEGMIASLLAFLAGDEDPEPRARVDLAAIVATLIDDAQDRGLDATYDGPAHCEMMLRASIMRRALSNLVENALHYGGNVRAGLHERPGAIDVTIDDDGPGIPTDKLDDVLRPFVRLDAARARNTRGLGLGLAIVAKAVAVEGGTLALANRAEGGLRVTLTLPRAP